jgi:hypothetical protein
MRARTSVAVAGGAALALAIAVALREEVRGADARASALAPASEFALAPAPASESALAPGPTLGSAPVLSRTRTRAFEHEHEREREHEHERHDYVPRGFPADFRTRIVNDFRDHIDARLATLSYAQREELSVAQQEFWDEHGPDVDAFMDGTITRLEFADRTHVATTHLAERMAAALSDAEYLALFDVAKGEDLYVALFHSADEQPGLPMKPVEDDTSHTSTSELARRPPPASPATHDKIPGHLAPIPKSSSKP